MSAPVTVEMRPDAEAFGLDVKRFYVPGCVIRATCPKCGANVNRDMGLDYFSYPAANVPFDFRLYCGQDGGCETEWSARLIIRLSVEVAK